MTEKESRFARVYLATMDMEKAAKEIGGKLPGELPEKYAEAIRVCRQRISDTITREDVIRRLVQLGFRSGEECLEIFEGQRENIDLSLVSEIKRNGNGTVELKLIDRVAVLKLLLELLKGDEGDGAEAFLRSLQAEEGQE